MAYFGLFLEPSLAYLSKKRWQHWLLVTPGTGLEQSETAQYRDYIIFHATPQVLPLKLLHLKLLNFAVIWKICEVRSAEIVVSFKFSIFCWVIIKESTKNQQLDWNICRPPVRLANKQNKHVFVASTFEGGPRLPKEKCSYGIMSKLLDSFEY